MSLIAALWAAVAGLLAALGVAVSAWWGAKKNDGRLRKEVGKLADESILDSKNLAEIMSELAKRNGIKIINDALKEAEDRIDGDNSSLYDFLVRRIGES